MRPRQWTKNLFVLVALFFANAWSRWPQALIGFAIFCAASSAVYLLNDVADREQDARHPVKRNRPVASGALPWQAATAAAVLLTACAAVGGWLLHWKFGVVTAAYLLLQGAYTAWLKHEVIVDVFCIAAGFVLRTIAGGFAVGVPISVWLLVCTLQISLFLGFGKRRNELMVMGSAAGTHRRILEQYSLPFLDQLIAIVLGGLNVSYAVYCITSPTAQLHHLLPITLPNVMYGTFRYLYLIHIQHKGGSPETTLLEDRPTQINLLLWLAAVVVAMRLP
jgi:4-hydroxybenzoate polyprenyltransferase